MSNNKRTIRGPLAFVIGFLFLLCVGCLIIGSSALARMSPDESDIPGLTQALQELEDPNFLTAVYWNGNVINKVKVHGSAPEETPTESVRRLHCPALFEVAAPFVGDEYDLEVKVTVTGPDTSTITCE